MARRGGPEGATPDSESRSGRRASSPSQGPASRGCHASGPRGSRTSALTQTRPRRRPRRAPPARPPRPGPAGPHRGLGWSLRAVGRRILSPSDSSILGAGSTGRGCGCPACKAGPRPAHQGRPPTMEVIKISPRGYCYGVVDAIALARRAAADPTLPRPIYILGMIVHNRHVVEELAREGVQ
ncbi:MAG TPA: hypothetical protein VIL40_02105, partial [Thermaerobacter sp.]